jgi:hypothetical protein
VKEEQQLVLKTLGSSQDQWNEKRMDGACVAVKQRRTTPDGVVRRNLWYVDVGARELNGYGRGW